MKVKIGDRWYDSAQEPICIQISEREQRRISGMDRSIATEGKYGSFPEDWGTPHDMLTWMASDKPELEDRDEPGAIRARVRAEKNRK